MSAAVDKDTAGKSVLSAFAGPVWKHGLYAALAWLLAAVVTVAFPDVVPWGSRDVFVTLLVAVAVLLAGFAFSVEKLGGFGRGLIHYGPWLIALGLWFALWELITAKLGWMPKPFFSPPHGLLHVYIVDWQRMLICIAYTARLWTIGFFSGIIVGFIGGVALGWSKTFAYWGMPILKLIGPVPASAWIPATFFLFPTTFQASLFLVALASGIPVAILTASGVNSVNRSFYDVARTLGASNRYLVLRVAIPAALPHVFVGLFMGLYYSFAVLVVAEMLGAKYGLGWYLQFQTAYSAYANVYAMLIVMALLCSGLVKLLFVVRDRLLGWQKGGRAMVAAAAIRSVTGNAAGLAIDFQGISHQYDLDGQPLPVLRQIDLTVAPGEFVALLGPSGCGKSTLLRLAAGLERPTSGDVLADGTTVTRPDPSRVLVFQDPTLFPWRTVRDNVAIGPEARGTLAGSQKRIDDALRLVKLEAFASAFPHQLSGGMAQRAALARALVNDPRLLLLDEPLGRLDSLTRLTMQEELLALWRQAGYTVILVTHDVEEALLLSERVIVLSERPARIKAEVVVDLPYPRRRDDPRIVAQRQTILEILGFSA